MRIFYGLGRLPQTLDLDDPRLPCIELGTLPLRLNTMKLPLAAWAEIAPGHAARWTALESWLHRDCGDYNKALRRAVSAYLGEIAAEIHTHDAALRRLLAPFDGFYTPQDWSWSALRPLPRAWWQSGDDWHHADLAYWDGTCVLTHAPSLAAFWAGETLPRSPFRR